MSKAEKTQPDVFIIESLDWHNELEGPILTDILRLSGKEPIYHYVRTKEKLEKAMGLFQKSRYRYLHLSCHGDKKSIDTTLNEIYFEELAEIMNPYLDRRRLFVSSCEVVNEDLAEAIIKRSGCLSVAGPTEKISFADAETLWKSFYKTAFDQRPKRMISKEIRLILEDLANLFSVPLAFYGKKRTGDDYSRRIFNPRRKAR